MPGGSTFPTKVDTFPGSHPNRDIVDAVTTIESTLINALWPVGSVYLSTSSTNPGTTFGFGTWSAIGQGRVLMGVGTGTDINSNTLAVTQGSGGDSTGEYKHTLSAVESGVAAHNHGITDPSHSHQIQQNGNQANSGGGGNIFGLLQNSGTPITNTQTATTGISVNNATATAAANAHNTTMPYYGVYAWRRTA